MRSFLQSSGHSNCRCFLPATRNSPSLAFQVQCGLFASRRLVSPVTSSTPWEDRKQVRSEYWSNATDNKRLPTRHRNARLRLASPSLDWQYNCPLRLISHFGAAPSVDSENSPRRISHDVPGAASNLSCPNSRNKTLDHAPDTCESTAPTIGPFQYTQLQDFNTTEISEGRGPLQLFTSRPTPS